ncbi:hypothetical protein JL722_10182 [Aureococcus anophagefferens]|nr:hypothetical protein JL722_10182 [Aureococcus anophagefferens]
MLSQFFVLSPRGDTIISKDFRGDSPQGAAEAFFRKVKFWSNDKGASGAAPPVFRVGDVTYVWVKKSGLMFACNSRFNCSPSMTLELLNRVVKGTSTENLKAFVYNEPVLVDAQKTRVPSLSAKTTPSTSVHKPIAGGKSSVMGGARSDKNEIFVDILERLTMLFSPSGAVVNSTIDGCIQMKSYLSGNPELRLALNEDLVVGKGGAYGEVESARGDQIEPVASSSVAPPPAAGARVARGELWEMAGRFWPLFALVAARTHAINRPKVRATIPADGRALACAFGVLGGFDKCVQVLAERRVVSRRAARKVMHMGAGPLYLLCWPMFSASPSAKAAVGPPLTAKAFSRRVSLTTPRPWRP